MSASNGNGKRPKPLLCEGRGCRRTQRVDGLCDSCKDVFDSDPDTFAFKGSATNQALLNRDPRTGIWVSKLTDEVTEKVCNALRAGAPLTSAATFAGINPDTLYDWMKKGRTGQGTVAHARFAAEVDKAVAEFKVGATATLMQSKDLRSIQWMLERRFPDEFGQVTRTEIAGVDGKPLRVEQTIRVEISDDTSADALDVLITKLEARNENTVDGEVIELPAGSEAGAL